MPGVPQELAEYERIARKVTGKTQYPIHNFNKLADALGGDETEVELPSGRVKVKKGRNLVPKHFFPIDSEEDLIAKMATLDAARPGYQRPEGSRGQEQAPSPDRKPPTRDVKELELPPGLEGGPSSFRPSRSG